MSIDYEQDGHVVTITINRPEAHNSLDMDHFRALLGAWTRFRDDESAWVAVVTGTGRAFCTGADLKSFIPELTGTLDRPDGWDRMDALHAVLHRFPIYKPIIAAVNGVCVAGGMEMLGSTDIRVATPAARFAVMEPKRGLFAGGGTTVRLLRQIAYPHAMELLLTADMIDAERALTMGILNRVVPADELMPAAYDYRAAHRGERPPGRVRHQAVGDRGAVAGPRGGVRQRGPAHGPRVRHRGREGRATGVRREAPPGLAGPLTRN